MLGVQEMIVAFKNVVARLQSFFPPALGDSMERTDMLLRTDSLLVDQGAKRTSNLRRNLVDKSQQPFKGEQMGKAPLFNLSDDEFIQILGAAFTNEFQYLRDADAPTVEQGSAPVKGKYGPTKDLSPSQFLYNGSYYPEVDRTVVGILAMKWILADDYSTFTAHQPAPIKLSSEAFGELRKLFIDTFIDSAGSYLLIVSMIVNDLGKSSKIRTLIRTQQPRAEIMNHDEVIYWAAEAGQIELVNEFEGVDKKRLLLGIKFGGKLNLGQLAQAENVPGSMIQVTEIMKGDPAAFSLKFLEVVLDVAGAQGHVDSRCATSWIAPVNQAYMTAKDCVLSVINEKASLRSAYDQILSDRAELLKTGGWKLLNVHNRDHRSLLRVILMARAATSEAAQQIEDAMNRLPRQASPDTPLDFLGHRIDNVHEAMIKGLSVDGVDDGVAIIPYYAPGMLSEAARVTKDEPDVIKSRAIAAVFRLMARGFVGTYPKQLGSGGAVIECDISFAQNTIRSEEFKTKPEILDKMQPPPQNRAYSDNIEFLMQKFKYPTRKQPARRGNGLSQT